MNATTDRRHTISQNYQHNTDRRHIPNMSDRRHISPPLHINICDNSTTINANQNDNLHARNHVDFSQRRHGRGKLYFYINSYRLHKLFNIEFCFCKCIMIFNS